MAIRKEDEIIQEAAKIVDSAKKENLILRVMGAVAFRIHCRDHDQLFEALGRELSDIDFAAHVRDQLRIEYFLKSFNYELRKGLLGGLAHPGRLIFFNPLNNLQVDVFMDRLDMNHTIEFKGRLEADYPTIPLAELLLEKMQIVRINEKDLMDTLVLFLEHDLGESDTEAINQKYISFLLANDWGFYFTVGTNLEKVFKYLQECKVFTEPQRRLIEHRVEELMTSIEKQPKSFAWKMRAKIGTRNKWYADVEEVER